MTEKIKPVDELHLNPMWICSPKQYMGEILESFRIALKRLNENADFIFYCPSLLLCKWVEKVDSAMFEEIKQMVKVGRWIILGGWYCEIQCNLASGESFARQFLYSQLFSYEKFGKINKVSYSFRDLADNGNMPQLLKLGGVDFCVFKNLKTENEKENNFFWWESADSSKVLAYNFNDSLNYENQESKPKSAKAFFEDRLNELADIPVYKGELQGGLRGSYSAVSKIKSLNRQAENIALSSEKFDTISSALWGSKGETLGFSRLWEKIMLNQSPYILGGGAAYEVYLRAFKRANFAMETALEALDEAVLKIASRIDTSLNINNCDSANEALKKQEDVRAIVVFNPNSYKVKAPVKAYKPSKAVTDSEGNSVLFQNVFSSGSSDSHLDTVFMAEVESFGYNTYYLEADKDLKAPKINDLQQDFKMENEYISVDFDAETGYIKSLADKISGAEYGGDNFLAIPTVIDVENTDTLSHSLNKFHKVKGLMELQSIERVENGALRSVIRVKHRFNESYLTQDFILAKGQKTLKVKCKALWQEGFTMLKFAFPIGGGDGVATYQIPYGFIKRTCNGHEEAALNWADLTTTKEGKRVGISIISDSKYSFDCPQSEIRLTALKNVPFAYSNSDTPFGDFNFTDEGLNCFSYGIYLHDGEGEKSDICKEAEIFNNNIVTVCDSLHKGDLPQRLSFLYTNLDNVNVKVLKRAEDGSGDLIIRLYETKGRELSRGYLMCKLFDNGFWFDIGKNQVKTYRIDSNKNVKEVNFLEGTI